MEKVQYVCRTGCERISGVEVLTYRISLPQWGSLERISDFYSAVEQRTLSFCETTLKKIAEEAFESSEDPRKRFCFPTFRYALEGRVTCEDTKANLLSVRLEAELKRKGTVDCLERQLQAHTWSLSEEMLLPPEQIAERLGGNARHARKIRKKKDVLVDQGEVYFLNGCVWEKFNILESSKKELKI